MASRKMASVDDYVISLWEKYPRSSPSDIAQLVRAHSRMPIVSIQKVTALRKKAGVSNDTEQSRKGLSVKSSHKGKRVQVTGVRKFKNLRINQTYEVQPGEKVRHFYLPGDTQAYSLDDFVLMIRKNCGQVREVVDGEISEVPIDQVTADDFVLGSSS